MKKIPLYSLVAVLAGCSGGGESDAGAPGGGAKLVDPLGRLGFALNFDQKPHTDEVNCHYVKTRNDSTTEVRRVRVKFPEGSHHVHIYRSSEPEEKDYVAPCTTGIDWNRWRLLVGVQTTEIDWTLPDGVTIELEPHQQLLVQVHWVNITNQTVSPTVQVDFEEAQKEKTEKHLSVAFGVAEDVQMDPRQKKDMGGWVPLPEGSKVIAIMGHYHIRGSNYVADIRTRGEEKEGRTIYEAQGEQTFVFRRYDTPEPVGADQGVAFKCAFDNPSQFGIRWGATVENEEHCNIAVYYEPPGKDAESKVYSQGFVIPATKGPDNADIPGTGGLTTDVKSALAGETVIGKVELQEAAGPWPVEVFLAGRASLVDLPHSVKVPPWQKSVTFPIRGLRPGVDAKLEATTGPKRTVPTALSFTGLALSEIVYADADPAARWVEISNVSSLPVNLCEYSLGAGTSSYADFAKPLVSKDDFASFCKKKGEDADGNVVDLSYPVMLPPFGCLLVGIKGVSNKATGMMVGDDTMFGAGFMPPADGSLGIALIDFPFGEWGKGERPAVIDAVAFGTSPNPDLYDQSEFDKPEGERKGITPIAPVAEGSHERGQAMSWKAVPFKTPGVCRVTSGI